MSPFPKVDLYTGGENSQFLPGLLSAINYATHIDITTAFIRQTGLMLIIEALEEALERKVEIRILTGDYLSITDPAALRTLMLLKERGAKVRIFESKNMQSFHMKAYIFAKKEFSRKQEGCVFIGSSNISHSALRIGLEWNVCIDQAENPKRFETVSNEFEALYSNPYCKELTHQWIDSYVARHPKQDDILATEAGADEELPPPHPNSIQTEALEALQSTRDLGYKRGLVVMATGLGKTWLAAFDTEALNAKRVLFVAHRDEILTQAEHTFVRIRPDAKTGKYTGKNQQLNVDMLFASIQTLGKQRHLNAFRADYFDYIIVDEFHHAAARTYQQLLAHFKPRFLLGLTATPDRTDRAEILNLCDDNLVYNKDLFDGINAGILSPFDYFGIGDKQVNYQEISWRSGRFDPSQLANQLATYSRAQHNFDEWKKNALNRTLAFCVSKKHADFMADFFTQKGVRACAVYSDSTVRRNDALEKLREGEIDVLFSVDLFNEGIDVPAIDTVLMLRPTESRILFLQQLGRGLRKFADKQKLVVIDFIGNHISFFRKAEALFKTGVTNAERKEFIERANDGTLQLPEGCFVNYDLTAMNFMRQLTQLRADVQEDLYTALKEAHGRRPSISEFYFAGGSIDTIRKEHGQWFNFVAQQKDLTEEEVRVFREHRPFLKELETTSLNKSFKLVTLEAMLNHQGFKASTSTKKLAIQSFDILQRRRNLLIDLPEEFAATANLTDSQQKKFHTYWLNNPVNAWIGGNKKSVETFFEKTGGEFRYVHPIPEEDNDTFSALTKELVSYRFLQYEQRLELEEKKIVSFKTEEVEQRNILPFFTDLRIACGHFSTSTHDFENIVTRQLPVSYGHLDPARHFVARAKGRSMDGGMNPIKDGDHLLLELITPENEGRMNEHIIAIERQDTSGEDQYLLRQVQKLGDGSYQLNALNPDYKSMIASKEMRMFARFVTTIDPSDLLLHQMLFKYEVAEYFGMEYKEGLWKMSGHVCPKISDDQFLFVNLNKQGADPKHRYHDYFESPSIFHWQTQNSTKPESKKGLGLINHEVNDSVLHLFVRKHKMIKGKGSPFHYCGRVIYQSHHDSAPMNIKFKLSTPLPSKLYQYFS